MSTIPRGIRNNNPLNLVKTDTPWLGKVTTNTDGHFEQFQSMLYGIRAAIINARSIIKRNRPCSVSRLISVWAPPVENNTSAYISQVCIKANVKATDVLDIKNKNQICRVLWAMSYVENGRDLSFQYFENAYALI